MNLNSLNKLTIGLKLFFKVLIRKLILIILDLSQYYLYIPMKMFEKIVHDQISVFVKENSYLNDRQSGFRKLFSEIILEEM